MLSGIAGSILHKIRSMIYSDSCEPGTLLPSKIFPLDIPLAPDEKTGFRSCPIFSGRVGRGNFLSAHVSVLSHGVIPHPLHIHREEEILILFTGELEVIISKEGETIGSGRNHLEPGHLIFYPSHFPHTIQSIGCDPANYLMFKWTATRHHLKIPLAFGTYALAGNELMPTQISGFHPTVIFEGSTIVLQKIQCHVSVLAAGAGYQPHTDPYDVVIVVLDGEVETLGERVKPFGIIFYASGEPHGIYNPGEKTARYLVIEFHWQL